MKRRVALTPDEYRCLVGLSVFIPGQFYYWRSIPAVWPILIAVQSWRN